MNKQQTCSGIEAGLNLIMPMIISQSQIIIAISGYTCSGKSYLAELLAQKLKQEAEGASLVPMDSYYRDKDESGFPRDEYGIKLWDIPESYNQAEYVQAILDLADQKQTWEPEFDKHCNKRIKGKEKLIRPKPCIIGEGLFSILFLKSLPRKILKVYLDTDLEKTCLPRRIARDTKVFGESEARISRAFALYVVPFNLKHVLPQKNDADIVIIE